MIRQNVICNHWAYGVYSPTFAATAAPSMLIVPGLPDPRIVVTMECFPPCKFMQQTESLTLYSTINAILNINVSKNLAKKEIEHLFICTKFISFNLYYKRKKVRYSIWRCTKYSISILDKIMKYIHWTNSMGTHC